MYSRLSTRVAVGEKRYISIKLFGILILTSWSPPSPVPPPQKKKNDPPYSKDKKQRQNHKRLKHDDVGRRIRKYKTSNELLKC